MITAGLLLVLAGTASGVELDPALEALLAAKAGPETVPVIMVYDEPPQLTPEFLAGLEGASPEVRRREVLRALRNRFDRVQGDAMQAIELQALNGTASAVRPLYMAGAIAFSVNRSGIDQLLALPDAATLCHDQTYPLISHSRPGRTTGSAPAAADTAWSLKAIRADRVWNELGLTGKGVLVGHIDTGVYLEHPDLVGGIWVNPGEIAGNGLDDDSNGYIDDVHGWDFGVGDNDPNDDSPVAGHGTHTAGTVIGDGTGGTLTGVASDAELMVCKVWQANGQGGTLGMIWEAEQYCAEMGARIITMSLSVPGNIPRPIFRTERYNLNNIRSAGVAVFNSAGNDHDVYEPPFELGLTARVPAPWNPLPVPYSSTGGVISVGGLGYKSDEIYAQSSRGPARWDHVEPWHDWPLDPGPGLTKPDIALPAVNVNSTVIPSGYSGDTWTGTSMACPHAAGIAALMLEKNPSLSPAGIDSLMELTAVDLGDPGKDNAFGSGKVDAWTVVQATPEILTANIYWAGILPDPAGNGVLEPGVSSEFAFELVNRSPAAAGLEVEGSLAVVENPFVRVIDAHSVFTDLAQGGGTGSNASDPFVLQIDAAAPHGFEFTALLTVRSAGGFERTFDVPWFVGLPENRTHDMGGVYLTVTDQGILGYMSQDRTEGEGMGYGDGDSGLFVGSFWAGTDSTYICNRDYSALGYETYEWVVSSPNPNGRVRDLGAAGSDQTFASIFTDAGHANPRGLQVEQTSMAYGDPESNGFVILEYRITHVDPGAFPGLHSGVYCDFDVSPKGEDYAGTDLGRNLAYIYADGGPYFGVMSLEPDSPANVSAVDNLVHVYPLSSVSDADKMRLLRGEISAPTGPEAGDWSVIVSTGVHVKATGGPATMVYAVVFGGTLAELQENADAALANYDPDWSRPDQELPSAPSLAQNYPNPFNPGTEIAFSLPVDTRAVLAIYDLKGRRVRILNNGTLTAGDHTRTWLGTDERGNRVPSGVYFYRLEAAGQVLGRKLTLLK